MSANDYVLGAPFETVRGHLEKMEQVDGMSGGLSPITIRWLTKKNVFINIGLEEKGKESCRVIRNNNSFQVKEEDLQEAHQAIQEYIAGKEANKEGK